MKFQESPIPENEYITGNKFIEICEKYKITFAKTDFVFDGLSELRQVKQSPKAFVTHQSDFSITEEHKKHLPADTVWFAENCEVVGDPNIIGIPNGLNNMNFVINKTSKDGRYSSCFSHLADFHRDLSIQHENKRQVNNLVYMNFTADTFASERTEVFNLFSDKRFVTKKSKISHQEFAKDVYNHPFTLSPRGNGYDCVRTWEAIYLGSIPIIKINNVMSHFKELPILFVGDWKDVNESFLEEKINEFSKKDFDLSKAKISYWDSVLEKFKR